MIALQNKYYSGHYRTIEDGAAEEHLEETVGKRTTNNGLQEQLEVAAQDQARWRSVLCGQCFIESDKA